MSPKTVKLQILLESLIDAIVSLGIEEKHRLWQILDEELAQAEEELLEENPTARSEIEQARLEYQTGDYKTIDEYISDRAGKMP